MKNNNKKIIIAIFFSIIMIAGIGLVLFNNDSNNIPLGTIHNNAINSGTNNSFDVPVGATNSGLTVPLSDVGYSGANGSSVTTSSYDSVGDIGNDGSVYYISGNTLIVNTTTTITNEFIGYNIEIKSGAILTLGSGVILDELFHGNGYNNYTAGQLIINDAKIHGNTALTYENPILAYVNNSLTYANVDLNILGGNNDTFSYNTTLEVSGTVSNSHFAYNNVTSSEYLEVYAGNSNALIKNSYFEGVNNYLNDNTNYIMNIQHSAVSFNSTYVKSDAYGNAQLTEQYVNLSYVNFIAYAVPSYEGLMLFDYSNYYNDYANFTIPKADWGNTAVIASALTSQGYGTESYSLRGSTNDNNSLVPVYMAHNEFAGLDGFELYGTGHSYIENNIITEQFFWTAYITMFSQYNEPLKNSIIANNTLYYYGDSTLENNIDSDINEGGGNTYITSGEAGNLLVNVSIVYNTFQGILGTVTENTNQHASFILGAYAYVNHNYFDVTSTFNSGHTINAPEMEFDEFQTNGVSNVSYNYFYGLSSVTVAIAFIPVSSATNYGTEILYANEYRGSNSAYQITAYTGYTINAINKTNYQYLTNNGTVSMVSGNSPNGYTANSYAINDVSITTPVATAMKYNVTILESGLPANISWSFTFNGTTETLTNTSYKFSVTNGSYAMSVNSVSGYTVSYNNSVTVNGTNVTENVVFTSTTKVIGVGNYTLEITLNNPNLIFYTLIVDENNNATYYNISSTLIIIHDNNSNFPLTVEFINLKSGYSISIPEKTYYNPNNYILNENIINNNGNPEYEFAKYFPEIAVGIIIMGFILIGAVVKRR